ncbi:hypothetical protein RJ640_015410 [Escallonia rubra]|uniref:SANT domain-containing protein n=1 Tax=Escallonia rubra TaxID=112253 RepID=A0AA88UR36_9ASTE|nr:hypothetical protein RJ640_015410 [Escallonia rubra]
MTAFYVRGLWLKFDPNGLQVILNVTVLWRPIIRVGLELDNLYFPLKSPNWNADEEILILEGIEMYGMGNWPEVAEQVGTKANLNVLITRYYLHELTVLSSTSMTFAFKFIPFEMDCEVSTPVVSLPDMSTLWETIEKNSLLWPEDMVKLAKGKGQPEEEAAGEE